MPFPVPSQNLQKIRQLYETVDFYNSGPNNPNKFTMFLMMLWKLYAELGIATDLYKNPYCSIGILIILLNILVI